MKNALTQQSGEGLLTALTQTDYPDIRKRAEAQTRDVMVTQVREGSLMHGILVEEPVNKSELLKTVNNRKPQVVRELDTRSPGAYTLGFGGAPMNFYMQLPRVAITFGRTVSYRLYADVNDLLTYSSKIHQIFHDLLVKDVIDEHDRMFMRGVNEGCGALNSSVSRRATLTGAKGYVTLGASSRAAMMNFRKALTVTEGHLTPAIGLVNDTTIWDFAKAERTEVGGDLSEKMWVDGFTMEKAFGLNWKVTTKNHLVPDGRVYQFADPDKVGWFLILDELTFVNKSEAWYLDTFCYDCTGGALPNPGAFASGLLSGSFTGWAADESSSS